MFVKITSMVMSMTVLMSTNPCTQSRPRETSPTGIVDQQEIDDHLQSLREIQLLEERADRARRQQRDWTTLRKTLGSQPQLHKPPPPPPPSKVEIVVRYALAQVGDPYVWAADGPGSFDCSGLVLASYARVGISLPHYTGWIIGRGTHVSRSQLQRGDVVFPASGHVGIYLGNGMFVHASSSKGRVTVGELYSFYAARRFLK